MLTDLMGWHYNSFQNQWRNQEAKWQTPWAHEKKSKADGSTMRTDMSHALHFRYTWIISADHAPQRNGNKSSAGKMSERYHSLVHHHITTRDMQGYCPKTADGQI